MKMITNQSISFSQKELLLLKFSFFHEFLTVKPAVSSKFLNLTAAAKVPLHYTA